MKIAAAFVFGLLVALGIPCVAGTGGSIPELAVDPWLYDHADRWIHRVPEIEEARAYYSKLAFEHVSTKILLWMQDPAYGPHIPAHDDVVRSIALILHDTGEAIEYP